MIASPYLSAPLGASELTIFRRRGSPRNGVPRRIEAKFAVAGASWNFAMISSCSIARAHAHRYTHRQARGCGPGEARRGILRYGAKFNGMTRLIDRLLFPSQAGIDSRRPRELQIFFGWPAHSTSIFLGRLKRSRVRFLLIAPRARYEPVSPALWRLPVKHLRVAHLRRE